MANDDPQYGQTTSMSSIKFISGGFPTRSYTPLLPFATGRPFAFRRKLNLQRDAFRIAPQAFQRVEFAFLALKKVNDHVAVIEDDPLACGETIL